MPVRKYKNAVGSEGGGNKNSRERETIFWTSISNLQQIFGNPFFFSFENPLRRAFVLSLRSFIPSPRRIRGEI